MVKQHQVGAAKATWNPWNQLNDAQCTNKQDRHSYQHIQNGNYYHMYIYIIIYNYMYIIHYRKMTASVFEDPQTTERHGFSWIFSITYYHHVPFFNCLATLFINHIHPVISRFSLVFFGSTHSINRFLNASEEQRIFFSARRGRSRGARPGNAWRAQVGRWRCGSDGSH